MFDPLSESAHFKDHLEIVGFLTLGLASMLVLVYFGMIFFYEPVRTQPALIQLGTLILYASVAWTGFFIPRGAAWARRLYLLFFGLLAVFAWVQINDHQAWPHFLTLGYAVYAWWVLTHPLGLAFFRPLSPLETQRSRAGGWLPLHLAVLVLTSLILIFRSSAGLLNASANDPLVAWLSVSQLGAAFLALVVLTGMRRLWPGIRWLAMLLAAGLSLSALPMTLAAKTYPDYWLALLQTLYFAAAAAYWAFAKGLKQARAIGASRHGDPVRP